MIYVIICVQGGEFMTEKTALILAKREFKRENVGYIEGRLREEITAAIQSGYRRFLIGFDFEIDRMGAEIVIERKTQQENIILNAVLAFAHRDMRDDKYLQELLSQCEQVRVFGSRYFTGCYRRRNEACIRQADRLIVVMSPTEKGDLLCAIETAQTLKKEVFTICIG